MADSIASPIPALLLAAAAMVRVLSERRRVREEPARIAARCKAEPPTALVSALWIYPVKSMRGHSVPAAELDAAGFVHDRRYMVIDEYARFVTQRGVPALATVTPHIELPPGELLEGVDSSPAVRAGATASTRPVLVLSVDPLPANSFSSAPPLAVPLVTREDLCGSSGGPHALPAGARLVDVVVWESVVEAVVDQGDAAGAWLSGVLGKPGLRLVHFDGGGSGGAGGAAVREIADSMAPKHSSGFSTEVSFADGFPLLVLGEASVATLNERLPADAPRIPLRNFRTNVVVASPPAPLPPLPAFAEDTWAAAAFGPQHVLLRGCKLCGRCRVTTTDQQRGEAAEPRPGLLEAEPLATLRGFRRAGAEVLMGLNASPQWDAPAGGGCVGLRWRPRGARVIRVGDAVHVVERTAVSPALTPAKA